VRVNPSSAVFTPDAPTHLPFTPEPPAPHPPFTPEPPASHLSFTPESPASYLLPIRMTERGAPTMVVAVVACQPAQQRVRVGYIAYHIYRFASIYVYIYIHMDICRYISRVNPRVNLAYNGRGGGRVPAGAT